MEIALDKAIPTYSGGLGVLAGDTLRSAADLAVSVVGITLLHPKAISSSTSIQRATRPKLRSSGDPKTCWSRLMHAPRS